MTKFPAWYYNEFQHVGTNLGDTAQVEVYDRNQTISSIEAEQQLIARLGISANHTVVDFGCGTGTFAIQAALVGARVYAVDVSQAMLTYAQQKATAANATGIEFKQAGFLTYEHTAQPPDFIVTKSALHHLPDFWKMVACLRMAALLKNDGILYLRDAVFSFNPTEYQTYVDAWIERVSKPPGEGWTASDFETHVREEYTTFGWIIERMVMEAGFEVEAANYFTYEYAEYFCRKQNHH